MKELSSIIQQAKQWLQEGKPASADRILSEREADAFSAHDLESLKQIWPILAQARQQRRALAGAGRIDLHTHTTASDGELTVEQTVCEHFRQGQILINDHNIIDSLAPARRLVAEYDLNLDIFLGIEVICTHQRRAFEFMAITPTLSDDFVELALQHRTKWNQGCERFVQDLFEKDHFFDLPLWRKIAHDHEASGSFAPVIEIFKEIQRRIRANPDQKESYLRNNQTFDLGNLWKKWNLHKPGDPPQLAHRFFGSMRCYTMNAYNEELADWFDYESLARKFKTVGSVISHNHPNYWDTDFIGELPHTLQEEWIRDWAARGVIDALEVWSPPFASKRVPHYWKKVANQCRLIPMAGTDCHSGREQQLGGEVENHPEIPPMLYSKLAKSTAERAAAETDAWSALSAWRDVLHIDYANENSLTQIQIITDHQ